MKFLLIEPFSTGSHALFAKGLAEHSAHTIDVIEMPGENFRWRMLASALYMADHIPKPADYDGIIVTDLFNLSDFKALVGPTCPPVLVYFHENQLTYPQPPGDKSAFMLGMINLSTALVADQVVFNSETHRRAFLTAVPEFLSRGKDFHPAGVAKRIMEKSQVLYPGISLPGHLGPDTEKKKHPPLIIWNHRWGYDKNFTLFFQVLKTIRDQGLDFRLALLGENFGMIPAPFLQAQQLFENNIIQFGYVPSRKDYIDILKQGDLVISTAIQENFGMSVIEAMICGCIPLLPNRLSYPEILPTEFHDRFLYDNKYDLSEKLSRIIADVNAYDTIAKKLARKMKVFLWGNVAADYDRILEMLAGIKANKTVKSQISTAKKKRHQILKNWRDA